MKITVVGSGPSGMVAALLLARSGHVVTVMDREAGPTTPDSWDKHSVFQFQLPHGFRPQIASTLHQRLPDVFAAVLALEPVVAPPPDGPVHEAFLGMRRWRFDRALWEAVDGEPGIVRETALVERLAVSEGRVTGVLVGEVERPADLVVDASGRGWVSRAVRGQPEGGDCDFGYICRRYRLRDGVPPDSSNGGAVEVGLHLGYQAFVFREDRDYFHVLMVRARSDRGLAALAEEGVWDAVVPTLPRIGDWVASARSEPVGPIRSGTGITNTYLGQATDLRGLLAIGDAVCITNPMGARGVSLGILSAAALVDVVTTRPEAEWAGALDAWCAATMRPWFDDQLAIDAGLISRWRGEPIDVSGPLPPDLVAGIVEADPSVGPIVGPYYAMRSTSECLQPLQSRAVELYASGWRPAEPEGPTHAELVEAVRAARQPDDRAA